MNVFMITNEFEKKLVYCVTITSLRCDSVLLKFLNQTKKAMREVPKDVPTIFYYTSKNQKCMYEVRMYAFKNTNFDFDVQRFGFAIEYKQFHQILILFLNFKKMHD